MSTQDILLAVNADWGNFIYPAFFYQLNTSKGNVTISKGLDLF